MNNKQSINCGSVASFHGGLNTPPRLNTRAPPDFIPISSDSIKNLRLIHCSIKMLTSAIEDREDILSIDSIPLNLASLIGRVENVQFKNSKRMNGEIFYFELTITDDTSRIKIQVYQLSQSDDNKQNIGYDTLQALLFNEGFKDQDPSEVIIGWYIKCVVKPRKNETEKMWKFDVQGLERIHDYNLITHHNFRTVVEQMQRSRGRLPIQYLKKHQEKMDIIEQERLEKIQQKKNQNILEEINFLENEEDEEEQKQNNNGVEVNLIKNKQNNQISKQPMRGSQDEEEENEINNFFKNQEQKENINPQTNLNNNSDNITQLNHYEQQQKQDKEFINKFKEENGIDDNYMEEEEEEEHIHQKINNKNQKIKNNELQQSIQQQQTPIKNSQNLSQESLNMSFMEKLLKTKEKETEQKLKNLYGSDSSDDESMGIEDIDEVIKKNKEKQQNQQDQQNINGEELSPKKQLIQNQQMQINYQKLSVQSKISKQSDFEDSINISQMIEEAQQQQQND